MIPVLDCEKLDRDFEGDLYFLFSQGLGDTVKGLRFVKIIQNIFPKSRQIIYSDKRWSEILLQIPDIKVRWYSDGIDVVRPEKGKTISFDQIKRMILDSPEYLSSKSFVAFEPLTVPDQFSKGESDVETMARVIGLKVGTEGLNAYLPDAAINHAEADDFLRQNGLLNQQYIVFSPHTWPVKDWGINKFIDLAFRLRSGSKIKILVLGLKDLGVLPVPEVVHGLSLPLGTVIGLIAKSSLLFGNDSGLAHIASAFNIPVVVVYKNREDLPFCIKVQSPFSSLVLSDDYFEETSSLAVERINKDVDTIHSVIISCLHDPDRFNKPQCPACQNKMEFFSSAKTLDYIWKICHCGSMVLTHLYETREGEINLMKFESFLNSFFSGWKSGEFRSINVLDRSCNTYTPWFTENFILSFDGLVKYVTKKGLFIRTIRKTIAPEKPETLDVEISTEVSKKFLEIPWGQRTLRVTQVFYYQYFAWRTWAIPLRWRGLPKMALQQNNPILACKLAFILFRPDPNLKLFRYFILSLIAISKSFFRIRLRKVPS